MVMERFYLLCKQFVLLVFFAGFLNMPSLAANTPLITDLGNFAAISVSNDGKILFGRNPDVSPDPVLFINNEFKILPKINGEIVRAVSDDGSVLLYRNFKSTNSIITPLKLEYNHGMSADGSVVYGAESALDITQIASETNGVVEILPTPIERTVIARLDTPVNISADGSVFVAKYSGTLKVFRWENGAVKALEGLGDLTYVAGRLALSADGQTIVGRSQYPPNSGRGGGVALRWINGGIIPTEFPPFEDYNNVHPMVVSGDGSVIIGVGQKQAIPFTSPILTSVFIWSEEDNKIRHMRDLFPKSNQVSSVDLFDQNTITSVTAISPNGRFVLLSASARFNINERITLFKRIHWLVELPSVTIKVKTEKAKYDPGDIVKAIIKVINKRKTPVTVTLDNPLLLLDDPTVLELTEAPKPKTFVLGPDNKVKEFEALFKANELGFVEITAEATVVDNEGGSSRITGSTDVRVGDPLQVTMEIIPTNVHLKGKADMEVEEDSDNPGTFIVKDNTGKVIQAKIKVSVFNDSNKVISSAIQGLDPRARDKTALGARIKTVGVFPVDLGDIAPDKTVEKEFDLDIRDDGRFDFKALATGVIVSSGKQFNTLGVGGKLAVGTPYPVEIDLEFVRTPDIRFNKNGAFFMKPGTSLKIIATVSNTTSNSRLNFYGINTKPIEKRNAKGGTFTDAIARNGPLQIPGQNIFSALAHDHEITANSSVVLSTTILTDPIGTPTGYITWLLPKEGEAELVDDVSGIKTNVSPDDILITSNLGAWGGDDLSIKLVQNNEVIPVPNLTTVDKVAVFYISALQQTGPWAYDSFAGLGALLAGGVHTAANFDGNAVLREFGKGGQSIFNYAELAGITWQGMSAEQKDEFIDELFEEVKFRTALFYFTKQPFKPEELEQARQKFHADTFIFYNEIESAYASNDPFKITQVLGKVSGNIGLEVISAGIPTPKFTRFTKLGDAAKLATNTAKAKLTTKVRKWLTETKGLVSAADVQKFMGLGGNELKGVQEVLEAMGMKGYARARSTRATGLIEVSKDAIGKMEAMKPKGFSEIDFYVMGEERAAQIGKKLKRIQNPSDELEHGLDGITLIYEPKSHDDLLEYLNTLPADKKLNEEGVKAVLEHRALREAEYTQYISEFRQWEKPLDQGGGISVDFNYQGNVANAPSGTVATANRKLDLLEIGDEFGAIVVPKVADDAGILKYITGDTDWVHFSWLDGTPLDPDTAGLLYAALSKCCGVKHGETISWFLKGQTVFKGKANQLSEFVTGKLALLEVTGDSLRLVNISPELSMLSSNGRDHLIFFNEGTKALRQLKDKAQMSNIKDAIFSTASGIRYVLLPSSWYEQANQADNSINGKDWEFNDSADARMLRKKDGSVEQFDGTNWQSWDPQSVSGKISVAPATVLKTGVLAGSSTVDIFDLNTLKSTELSGRIANFFKLGQRIIIAPGETSQEIRTIKEFGSLIFNTPLEFDHPEGTFVAVLSAAPSNGIDSDLDGIPDASDAFPNNPNESVDTDNDGIGNNADPDDDNDGFSDIAELAANTDPLDSNSKPAGQPESEPIPSLSQWTLLLLVLFLFMLGSIAARKNHRI